MSKRWGIGLIAVFFCASSFIYAQEIQSDLGKPIVLSAGVFQQAGLKGVFVGMDSSAFFKFYPREMLRTHRQVGGDDWITYNYPLNDPLKGVVTFYFHENKLKVWRFNDRPEVIDEYLGEFCSLQNFPVIFTAIKNVMGRIPYQDFLNITNRQRPVIFTEFYDSGTARFASSQEMIIGPDEAPCCKEGFTLVKLGLGLGLSKTPGPIEGVVAHELAHRVLDHIRKGNVNCNAERQSNALIKKWGFKEEFKEASHLFGQKKGDPAACQEVPAAVKKS